MNVFRRCVNLMKSKVDACVLGQDFNAIVSGVMKLRTAMQFPLKTRSFESSRLSVTAVQSESYFESPILVFLRE